MNQSELKMLKVWTVCEAIYFAKVWIKNIYQCELGEAIYGGTEDVCWSNHKRASSANGCEYLSSIEHFIYLVFCYSLLMNVSMLYQ